ncbi:uncharacterized protein LOC126956633 [Macaca thibetana thibetana]|uniref:uncharacterized protein LOC126956633 n=1 Tax=Macaca thibetana thibetana TaxID=257877 RepID=UPI0021BC50B8|nr:uncharacterized protein LOC126956633 [Macaca thibetana thibetana]
MCGVPKENNFDTVVISLTSTLERKKNKPDTLSTVLDDCEVESAISQQKVFKISQNTPRKKHFSESKTLLKKILPTSHNTQKTTSLSNADLSKMPFEDSKDVEKERKINFDIPGNITSDSHIQQSTEGINCLPNTITDIFPVQDGKDFNFSSSSSVSMQLIEAKAANVYCKGSKTPPAKEARLHLQNAVRTQILYLSLLVKLLCSLAPHSVHLTGPPDIQKPKENPESTFSFNHCADCVIDSEKEQINVTDRDFNKAILHSDSHAKAQQLLERKITPCLNLRPASGSSLAAKSLLNGVSHSTVEWNQSRSNSSR